jgi:hypothetical protein
MLLIISKNFIPKKKDVLLKDTEKHVPLRKRPALQWRPRREI